MMFSEPRFVITATVEPLDELKVALKRERRIDAWLMERRQKNAKTKPVRHAYSSRRRVKDDRSSREIVTHPANDCKCSRSFLGVEGTFTLHKLLH